MDWTLGLLDNFTACYLLGLPCVSKSPTSMSVSYITNSYFSHLWSSHQLRNTVTSLTVFVIADLHCLVNAKFQIYKGRFVMSF